MQYAIIEVEHIAVECPEDPRDRTIFMLICQKMRLFKEFHEETYLLQRLQMRNAYSKDAQASRERYIALEQTLDIIENKLDELMEGWQERAAAQRAAMLHGG